MRLIVGMVIPDADQESMTERLRAEYRALPIYLDEDTAEKHYNGFSNSILWYPHVSCGGSSFLTQVGHYSITTQGKSISMKVPGTPIVKPTLNSLRKLPISLKMAI